MEKTLGINFWIFRISQVISVAIVPEAGHSMSWENPSALAVVLHKEFSEG
jgi:hypothetical protein